MKTINLLLASAVASAAMISGATSANAATVIPLSCAGGFCAGNFGNNVTAVGNFTDNYEFTLPSMGNTSSSVTTSFTTLKNSKGNLIGGNNLPTDIDFNSIVIDGLYGLTKTASDPASEHWEYVSSGLDNFVSLAAGKHTISLNGFSYGAASYGGQLSFASGVPEPSSWALMILGVGAVGAAMRRKSVVSYNFA